MKSQTSLQLLEHLQAQGITSDKFAQIEQKLSTELKRRKEIKRLEGSLFEFVKAAWPSIDSAPFQSNWAIEALCLHLEAVTKGDIKRLLVNFPPRASKPVSHNAIVLTKRGLIRLGDIYVGDEVWTHRGRWRKVTAIHKQGVIPVLKIKTRSGREVEAAPDHPFLTPDGWVEAGKLVHQDVLGLVPLHAIKDDCGSQTMPAEEARLLGYMVGDGSCGGTPNITCADNRGASDMMYCAQAIGFDPKEYRYRMASNGYWLRRISLRAKHPFSHRRKKGYLGPVRQWLKNHGLDHQSSYTKMVPEAVMRGNNDVVRNFLGAYWSCDGFVSTKDPKRDGTERDDIVLGCDSVNKRFLEQLQILLLRIGINCRFRKKVVKLKTKRQGDYYTSYTLAIATQDDAWRFVRLIKFYHAKYDKLIGARKRRFGFDQVLVGDPIDEITETKPTECLCLTVDEDSSFTANGFAVHNTSVVSICYPAWVWARTERTHTSGPGVQFLCSSYNHDLSLQNSNKTRRLILSPWYQERWGKRYSFREDQNTKSQFDTSEGGSRIATSVGGSLLGIGGSILLADDLHNTETVESEAERETVTNYWKEFSSTRLNDPQNSAIVVVMQRLHQQDISGIIIEGNEFGEWTHLMIPMHHDLKRHCETVLKYDDEGEPEITWEDPRTEEGELMWPDRFDEVSVASIERSLGKYMSSGRLEQSPTPKEGSIFSSKDWMLYPEQGEKFKPDGTPEVKLEYPSLDFMMAYVDTAMTTKEENDWSAMTVWGVWTDYKGIPKAIMIDAWQARLEFFPLVEKVKATAKARKIDMLMIEAKANGLSVAQEIQRLTAGNEYAVKTDVPKGDKVARAYSIQHLFSNKLIYAPNRKWSDMVITECESFPKGAHDDLVDTVVGSLRYLRACGMLELKDEVSDRLNRQFRPVGEPERLYPV